MLDMDGTLYLGNRLFDKVPSFLQYIKEIGGSYQFLTNNSSKGVEDYVLKMNHLGIKTCEKNFLTSVHITIQYLFENGYAEKKLYVLGTKSFQNQLKSSGLNVTDQLEENIACLVMGFDTELTFQKLDDACRLLTAGVDYIATNPDLVCPTEYGYVPDCGSVSQMLYHAVKRRPVFIGKPSPAMPLFAVEHSAFTKEQAVVVGDRLYTDIACANNSGIASVLVLSGETRQADIIKSEIQPDFVFQDIAQLLEALQA